MTHEERRADYYHKKLQSARQEQTRLQKRIAELSKLLNESLTFRQLQDEVDEWASHNFGDDRPWEHRFMGVVEEVGELSHALLKQAQGIRGTKLEHEEAAQDAIGDIVVYLADLCSVRGWSFQDIVDEVWVRVKGRDWRKDPEKGGEHD